nr:transcriptional regulator [Rhizobium sp. Q54]
MGFDRVDWNTFKVTHDTLAWVVGARRSGVTNALHSLEAQELIRSTRGQPTVLDAQGLREAASESYGLAEREYARLIGEDFRGTKKSVILKDAPEFFAMKMSDEDVG